MCITRNTNGATSDGKRNCEDPLRRDRDPAALAALPSRYLALMGEFPLRPIRGEAEYERAAGIVHRLALREGELDVGEEAYLEVLEGLVERYDIEHHPIDTADVTPTRALRMLVEQAGMTMTELGELLGSKGAASELLSGKRKEPSKAQIARLCARFRVDASVFLLPARVQAATGPRTGPRPPSRGTGRMRVVTNRPSGVPESDRR